MNKKPKFRLFVVAFSFIMFIIEAYQTNKRKGFKMKKLIIALTVVLNVLTVACTSEKEARPEASADYATRYNETMKSIIASDSKYAEAMTSERVIQNNIKVFNELKNTLQASGCYNEKIEKAYFDKASVEEGWTPAEFAAMCMIAN